METQHYKLDPTEYLVLRIVSGESFTMPPCRFTDLNLAWARLMSDGLIAKHASKQDVVLTEEGNKALNHWRFGRK